jgi:preprotein translocase subunit SecG
MVQALITTLHVLVAAILIFMVLLQKGKGADIGAAFGGASQTIFGPRGAQSFMAKITTGAAVIFMITSLTLAISSAKKSSVMQGVQPTEQSLPGASAPLAPTPAPVPASK